MLKFEYKVYDLQHYQLIDYKLEYFSMNTGYDIDRNNRDKETEKELQTILIDLAGDQINFLKQLLARIL